MSEQRGKGGLVPKVQLYENIYLAPSGRIESEVVSFSALLPCLYSLGSRGQMALPCFSQLQKPRPKPKLRQRQGQMIFHCFHIPWLSQDCGWHKIYESMISDEGPFYIFYVSFISVFTTITIYIILKKTELVSQCLISVGTDCPLFPGLWDFCCRCFCILPIMPQT